MQIAELDSSAMHAMQKRAQSFTRAEGAQTRRFVFRLRPTVLTELQHCGHRMRQLSCRSRKLLRLSCDLVAMVVQGI